MAVYKVLQDVEAEDKFVGPLTLKQFIFAIITAAALYLAFVVTIRYAWYLALPFLPIIVTGTFLGFPWGRDQPTEVWLLARLRFLLKPRRRIWDQTGAQELVTVTAPKRDPTQYTNNLSQNEVKSRLMTLASTIDSRGWAIKNVSVNDFNQPLSNFSNQFSDRLIDPSTLPREVPTTDIYASDDIMDPQNNPLAQHFEELIKNSSENHRQAALEHMDEARNQPASQDLAAGGDHWFAGQGTPPVSVTAVDQTDQTVLPAVVPDNGVLSAEEEALLNRIHRDKARPRPPVYGHMRVIEPLSGKKSKVKKSTDPTLSKLPLPAPEKTESRGAKTPPPTPVTAAADPAILELATNNDRVVESLAREANSKLSTDTPGEVVIRLR